MLLGQPLAARTHTTAALFTSASGSTRLLRSSLLPQGRLATLNRDSYALSRPATCSRRHLHIPNVLLPPVLFTGLLLALYTWKSFVMVSLQNKIIYNPYLPPTARHEKISDWTKYLCGVEWKEIHMRSVDRTDLALAVASVSSTPDASESTHVAHHVYILYCQGNASSLPPRLPDHSQILRKIKTNFADRYRDCGKTRFTQVGLSYRGYWTSSGRPSEIGINYDTIAAVDWISQLHNNTYEKDESGNYATKPILIIWGQSIGSGFATNLAASGAIPAHLEPAALILETPFLSIKEMLEVLYPEKWLPYKYLYPFLRNHLDSYRNLDTIAARRRAKGIEPPHVFILQAGSDEIVPERHPEELRRRCADLSIPVETMFVRRAYHNDAIRGGRAEVAEFIMRRTASIIREAS